MLIINLIINTTMKKLIYNIIALCLLPMAVYSQCGNGPQNLDELMSQLAILQELL